MPEPQKLPDEIVQDELQQIVAHLPEIRWIRIVAVDGFSPLSYSFDPTKKKQVTGIDIEEDLHPAITAAGHSFTEHMSSEFVLGKLEYTIIKGKGGYQFILPVGDGQNWLLSFRVNGQPSIDKIIHYFKSRDYLAALEPLLKGWQQGL